jgi:hypothetical protein
MSVNGNDDVSEVILDSEPGSQELIPRAEEEDVAVPVGEEDLATQAQEEYQVSQFSELDDQTQEDQTQEDQTQEDQTLEDLSHEDQTQEDLSQEPDLVGPDLVPEQAQDDYLSQEDTEEDQSKSTCEEESLYTEPEIKLEDVYADAEISSKLDSENITISIQESYSDSQISQTQNVESTATGLEFTEEHAGSADETMSEDPPVIPKLAIIVPYRDRKTQYELFDQHMKSYLADSPIPYRIFYIHQMDNRNFNRGAMKNIGYIAVRKAYPNDYKNMTLVFNDVDTMPAKTTRLNLDTIPGVIKHFYGFNHTLGGIVSVNAYDFERLNGFPNFWAWGYEDNLLQIRAEKARLKIDRSVFYKYQDPHIIHLVDTPIREVNSSEFNRFLERTVEGISSINGLKYEIDDETGFVHVSEFNTSIQEELSNRINYDLRNGPAPFKTPVSKRQPRMSLHF